MPAVSHPWGRERGERNFVLHRRKMERFHELSIAFPPKRWYDDSVLCNLLRSETNKTGESYTNAEKNNDPDRGGSSACHRYSDNLTLWGTRFLCVLVGCIGPVRHFAGGKHGRFLGRKQLRRFRRGKHIPERKRSRFGGAAGLGIGGTGCREPFGICLGIRFRRCRVQTGFLCRFLHGIQRSPFGSFFGSRRFAVGSVTSGQRRTGCIGE